MHQRGDRHLSLVDMGAVVRGIVSAMTDEASRHGVDIHVDASLTLPVIADRVQIEQVLVNLIRNAIEALAGQAHGDKSVRVVIRELGREVEVAIEDDGPGISPELAKRLFQPFETSKRNGMGLGLWLSRELVKGHGGCLWWDSDTAVGTRFVFRLPRQ